MLWNKGVNGEGVIGIIEGGILRETGSDVCTGPESIRVFVRGTV